MYVVWLSDFSKLSSVYITSRRPLTSLCGFLETISNSCVRTYRRKDYRIILPGASLGCCLRRLLLIRTLSFRHCRDRWLTGSRAGLLHETAVLHCTPLPWSLVFFLSKINHLIHLLWFNLHTGMHLDKMELPWSAACMFLISLLLVFPRRIGRVHFI